MSYLLRRADDHAVLYDLDSEDDLDRLREDLRTNHRHGSDVNEAWLIRQTGEPDRLAITTTETPRDEDGYAERTVRFTLPSGPREPVVEVTHLVDPDT